MKRLLQLMLLSGAGAALMPLAHGQTDPEPYQIPIPFEAHGVQFAPGSFVLRGLNNHLHSLHGERGPAIVLLVGIPKDNRPLEASRMAFRRSGSRYFLAEVWNRESGTITAYPPSSHEMKLLRTPANPGSDLTVLAGR